MRYQTTDLDARFWAKVEKSDGCWLWRGRRTTDGYGSFDIERNGRWTNIRSHRMSWLLSNGPIPVGLVICHRCDNPPCVRPDHLFLGTQMDNMSDAAKKGRIASGERSGTSKLSAADIAEIRTRAGTCSQRRLADDFGVDRSLISLIVNGRIWIAR